MRTVRKCPPPVLLTLLLVFLAAGSAVGQEDPPADFDSALKVLRAAGTLDDKAIGYAGAESNTWRAHKVFRDRGTLAQHTKLTADVKLEDYPARSRAEHLHGAIQHHRVKVYIPLLRRLWVEDGRLTPEDIRWLEKVDGVWVRQQREGGGD